MISRLDEDEYISDYVDTLFGVLKTFAKVYAAHPQYREDWKHKYYE